MPSIPTTHLPRIGVLCDFDGTACPTDVINEIYRLYGDCHCHQLNRLWDQEQVTSIEEYLGCFAGLNIPPQYIEQTIFDGVALDPGFLELRSYCAAHGYPFAVISDGLRWYIEYILRRHGVREVTIFSNNIRYTPAGYELEFPYYDPATPQRGVAKPNIVRRYKELAGQVVYIGDGLTDVEGAQFADIVFAKGRLRQAFQAKGLSSIEFSRIPEIVASLKRMDQDDSG